jgi:hypothetical protein
VLVVGRHRCWRLLRQTCARENGFELCRRRGAG